MSRFKRRCEVHIPLNGSYRATHAGNICHVSQCISIRRAEKSNKRLRTCPRAFWSSNPSSQENAFEPYSKHEVGGSKEIVCPVLRLWNMGSTIDTLADQLSSLVLIIKSAKNNATKPNTKSFPHMGRTAPNFYGKCRLYCKRTGHFANECFESPSIGIECSSCGSIRHTADSYWWRKSVFEHPGATWGVRHCCLLRRVRFE